MLLAMVMKVGKTREVRMPELDLSHSKGIGLCIIR